MRLNIQSIILKSIAFLEQLGINPQFVKLNELDRLDIPICGCFDPERGQIISVGKGMTWERAKLISIYEAIERKALEGHGEAKGIIKSYNQLMSNAINPELFILPDDLKTKYDNETEIEWVRAYSIFKKKKIYIPANLAFCPFTPKRSDNFFTFGSTNGAACGDSLQQAILSGLYEVVERDAYAVALLNHLELKSITMTGISNKELFVLLNKFQAAGIEIHIKDMTSDIQIPTVLALAIDHKEEIITKGAATHPDPEQAIISALLETVQLRISYLLVKNNSISLPGVEVHGFKELFKNLAYLINDPCNNYTIAQMRNILNNTVSGDLKYCLELLGKKNLEVLYFEHLKTDKGLCVVKVLVPGLQPLQSNLRRGPRLNKKITTFLYKNLLN